MTQILIQQYLNELSDLRRVSGTARESVVREAFKTLLKNWGRSRDLVFVPEHEHTTLTKSRVYVDGALLHALRVPLGYWEAKDEEDDLDKEMERKFRKGYPQDNILFEDSHTAVLVQNRQEVMRCTVDEPVNLEKLLNLFFSYEPEEIAEFRKAVDQFKTDLPAVLSALRGMVDVAESKNPQFRKAATKFLKHAQDTINPSVTAADVREMLIQHILTEEIFSHVFDNSDFHRRNNVAKELYRLEETFFTGSVKNTTLAALKPYYAAIKSNAALVSNHNEKQKFLKVIYENFYKVYDKKKADRLGVVYTPNELVRFMVEATDWLCHQHFGKKLIDRQVEILDPAVGTGTFIAELIEHFRGQRHKLRQKYLEELHANEVAILPYYVANLNIEATYAALAGEFEEYPNLCFVDTLDNTTALQAQKGQHFGDLFGGVSEENVVRIKRQNKKKISVVIGNPPYKTPTSSMKTRTTRTANIRRSTAASKRPT
jgi:predicted helicase